MIKKQISSIDGPINKGASSALALNRIKTCIGKTVLKKNRC